MKQNNSYLIPFILITSLFFLWGMAHSMLDVLNKHFQEALGVSKAASGFIQFVVFGAYFIMALPAGYLLRKVGYKWGIVTGLLLYAAGALLFYPAAEIKTFGFFLFALFIIASGLTILETAANPYVTVLGPPHSSEQRLNLSQSFNGLGWVLGPLIGGLLVFSGEGSGKAELSSVQLPYVGIGVAVLGVAFLFTRIALPEITADSAGEAHAAFSPDRSLFRQRHFVYGVIAQFVYVGAQVGIGSYFINYTTETLPELSNQEASFYLSGAMFLFMAGRFLGTFLMRYIRPQVLLSIFALAATVMLLCVIYLTGMLTLYALLLVNLFMSIMFPTIFALAIKDLGSQTKQASSFLIMSVVGGAVFTPFMGYLADTFTTSTSFWVPLICFVFVGWYAAVGSRVKGKNRQPA
jgi:FHS family L-fucose permease-like MFS transporter